MTNPVYVLANPLRSISWCYCFCSSVMTRPYSRKLIAGYFFLFVSVECFYLSQKTARFLCPWCGEMWSQGVISFHKAFVFDLNIFYCKKKCCVNGLGTRYENKIRPLPPYTHDQFNYIFKTERHPPLSQVKLQCQETYEIWEITISKNSFLIVVYFGQGKTREMMNVFYLSISEKHIDKSTQLWRYGLVYILLSLRTTKYIAKKNNETLWF